MDDTPLYKRPWFYIAAWMVILLVAYGWQIMRMGGFVASEIDIFIDLVCIFPLLLVLWMAFFAQFVLPVRTFRDRQKMFDRHLTYLFGGHGPAIFIRDGQLVMREGEERQKGPGVLWLESASAAVTRTATAIKQTMGPGVHFIENGEFIAVRSICMFNRSRSAQKNRKAEANMLAERTFVYANEVEKIHADLYKKALENLGNNVETDYYVC